MYMYKYLFFSDFVCLLRGLLHIEPHIVNWIILFLSKVKVNGLQVRLTGT